MKPENGTRDANPEKEKSTQNSPIFQKPRKSNKINIKNPSTGQTLNLPTSSRRNEPSSLDSLQPSTPSETSNIIQQSDTLKQGPPQTSFIKPNNTQGVSKAPKLLLKNSTEQPPTKESREPTPSNPLGNKDNLEPRLIRSQEAQWKPDVYIHAYVPEAFLAVNAAPAILISSAPIQGIDFLQYASTFAGSSLLPPLAPVPPLTLRGDCLVDTIDCLSIDRYENHFLDCLILDLEAQIPEIRTYDMFGAQLNVVDRSQEIYRLHVSGIRENTPRVAFGDNVMIRQLIMDPTTKLPLSAPAAGSTGYQISAVVVAIDRPAEVLHLRVNGFTPHLLMCNVSFMVQTRWIKSLQRALTSMALEIGTLQQAQSLESPGKPRLNGTISPEKDFGAIGTPVKSPSIRARRAYIGGGVASPLKSPGVSRYDYFEAISAPVISPLKERSDYFGSNNDSYQQDGRAFAFHGQEEPKSDLQNLKHSNEPLEYNPRAWLRRMLFPTELDGRTQKTLPQGYFKRSWFDGGLNHEQKKAVNGILSGKFGSIPFVVDGPPGTGKTKTMVETILQLVFNSDHKGTVLVCAPSDQAADTVALRLRQHLEPKILFRLNDFSRTFAEVPQELLPYCYIEEDIFNLPPVAELMACKVVIATCRAADVLVQARVTNRDLVMLQETLHQTLYPHPASETKVRTSGQLHWTALLVDEAAQATEPEMLIPVSVVAPPTSCRSIPNPIFVMAGDQYQLGPRVYSKSTTLGISFFERISERALYADHPLARKSYLRLKYGVQMLHPAFVHLTRNYRSHPSILAVSSMLFYSDTLIPEATETDALESWEGWKGRCWPVLFACNGGIDNCENIKTVGGGWFNVREAKKAISYAQNLLDSGLIEEQSEICIMSPFRGQVNVLRNVARKNKLWGLNIGPTDAFQGLESRFVIICTTRTRSRFLKEDALRGTGIVHEPKKFNVAITRARQGLIVLGNPFVLEQDPHWLAFMHFCWRNGLWQQDDEGPDSRMDEEGAGFANDWVPDEERVGTGLAGLEKALLYKEREPAEGGSQAVRRFMNDLGEDEIWKSGRLAEAALEYDQR